MKSTKERIASIDIFRYICSILVIAIHTRPFEEINASIGFIAAYVIPRIAVPFFFIISGYFYVRKLQNGEDSFKHYFIRLISVYFVWSCLYYFIDFVQWGHTNFRGFILNCLVTFVYYGSSYHFWFFPAMLFSLCFTTMLWRLGGRRIIILLGIILYTIGVLGCAYYDLVQHVPLLGWIITHPQFNNIRRIFLMGFPFFIGGYVVLKMEEMVNKKQGLILWIISLIIWILEIVVVVKIHCQINIVLTFGLYPLVVFTLIVLLKYPLPELQRVSDISRKLANFTYYTHPAYIILIGLAEQIQAFGGKKITNTTLFLLTLIATFATGIFLCKLKKPVLNKMLE